MDETYSTGSIQNENDLKVLEKIFLGAENVVK